MDDGCDDSVTGLKKKKKKSEEAPKKSKTIHRINENWEC